MIHSYFCLYQDGRLVVNVVIIKVTFSIIGLHNSSYTSIQSNVSFSISGEYQKMWGICTPANLILMMKKLFLQNSEQEYVHLYLYAITFSYLAHHSLHDSIKSTLWSVSVSRHYLLPHFLCEASYLFCQWQHMFEPELSLAILMNSAYREKVSGGG